MAQHVETIAGLQERFSLRILFPEVGSQSALNLQRIPAPLVNIGQAFDMATAIGKDEIELTSRTDRLPLLERICVATASTFALPRLLLTKPVSALPSLIFSTLRVYDRSR